MINAEARLGFHTGALSVDDVVIARFMPESMPVAPVAPDDLPHSVPVVLALDAAFTVLCREGWKPLGPWDVTGEYACTQVVPR